MRRTLKHDTISKFYLTLLKYLQKVLRFHHIFVAFSEYVYKLLEKQCMSLEALIAQQEATPPITVATDEFLCDKNAGSQWFHT